VRRRLDRGGLAQVWPFLAFIAFGMTRVVAPVSLIGLVFHHPVVFAIVSAVVVIVGAALLFIEPIELRVSALLIPSRAPTPDESARLTLALGDVGARAGIDTSRLTPRVQDTGQVNASAGGAHMLFVTDRALRHEDTDLEALLAHELGHHRGLHPIATTMIWWLSLPGAALSAVYRGLRRLAVRLTHRVRPLAVVVQVALLVWQASVMWLEWVAQLLAARGARLAEFSADRAAAEWGYGDRLATLLASLSEPPQETRIARLRADHPPIAARLERLAALSVSP
jgi:Zn-dependent protease with chaperone function